MWDATTNFGKRIEERLAKEEVIWLVTTNANGVAQPSPVWFLREGDTLLIYSQPNKPKLQNIARQPQVALNFNSNSDGSDVIIFHGEASVDSAAPPPDQHAAYLEKYRAGIGHIGMTPESFAAAYSVGFRVKLQKVRGF